MMLLAYDPATYPLNNNEWSFPLCEIIHIVGFGVGIGTIAMVDLRLMGLAFKDSKPSELLKATSTWTLLGLILVLTTGPLIYGSDPNLYNNNPSFKFKMVVLLIALLYNYTVRRKVAMADGSGGGAAAVGLVSILLWASLIYAGIFIAFIA
jgi:hypothetical protein